MSINLSVPEGSEATELKPRITVVGVGGAGGNAVNNMIHRELEGVDFVVANTDAQALLQSRAERRIQLGATLTEGLGAGSRPEVGAAAAEEAKEEVIHQLNNAHMAFIAAGMGGGTGTGAAPVIARAAKEAGILTVAVVTKPFQFEGSHRMRLAESGIDELAQYVDTLIIIPNQNLFRVATENTTFADAFAMADEVLYSGVRGVTDLMVMPGLINLDFADIRSVMSEMGKAMMGTGEAEGDRRALEAAEAAIANPLLDDTSMKGAKGVLINITGGADITLFEVDEAASRIRAEVDQDAYIIIGSAFDAELDGKMRVSVVATGIDTDAVSVPQPTMMRVTDAISRARPVAPVAEAETPAGEVEAIHGQVEAPTEVDGVTDARSANEAAEAVTETVAASDEIDDEGVDTAATAPEVDAAAASELETLEEIDSLISAIEPVPAPADTPAGMPKLGGDDVFVPPVPKSPDIEPAEAKPDPFAAAAMANGALKAVEPAADAAAERPSLFERVTRTGRAAIGRKSSDATPGDVATIPQPVENEPEKAMPAASAVVPDPIGITPAKPVLASAAEAVRIEPEQPPLAELSPADDATDEEEDLLDIPAFLRRQAN